MEIGKGRGNTSESFIKYKKTVLQKVKEAGFTNNKSSKYGSFSFRLNEKTDISKVDVFINYACSILEEVG